MKQYEEYNFDNFMELGPTCPYCGSVNDARDSDGVLYDESTDEYTCDFCDRDFAVTVFVTHSWNTNQKETTND